MPIKSSVELLPHQERAANRVLHADGNQVLGMWLGSGKGLASAAAFDKLRDAGKASRALVVTPASLRTNYSSGVLEKFTTDSYSLYGNKEEVRKGTHKSIDAPISDAPYHIVGYELFRDDPQKWIDRVKPDTLILDELHRAKDDHGLTNEALKSVRSKVRNVIGITSSFIGNSPSDVVGILNIVAPEEKELGNKEDFERRFLEKVDGKIKLRNLDVLAPILRKHISYFGPGSAGFNDSGAPRKVTEEVHVEMSPRQEELMRYVFGQIPAVTRYKLQQDTAGLSDKDVSHIFAKIMAARQVSNSVHSLDPGVTPEEGARRTPKMKKILDDVEQHLKETKDGQVLLVSHLIHGGVDVLSAGLKDRGISHGIFVGAGRMGSTATSNLQAADDYNSRKIKALVLSPAGGEGLSLPDTTFVGVADGHFNPERVLQMEARGIRVGGQEHRPIDNREVLVRRYLSIAPTGIMNTFGSFLKRLTFGVFGSPDPTMSTDKWIYDAARAKAKANLEIREALAKPGVYIPPTPPPTSERALQMLENATGVSRQKLLENSSKAIQVSASALPAEAKALGALPLLLYALARRQGANLKPLDKKASVGPGASMMYGIRDAPVGFIPSAIGGLAGLGGALIPAAYGAKSDDLLAVLASLLSGFGTATAVNALQRRVLAPEEKEQAEKQASGFLAGFLDGCHEKTADNLSVLLTVKDPAAKSQLSSLQANLKYKFPGLRDFVRKHHFTLAYARGMNEEQIKGALPEIEKVLDGVQDFDLIAGPIKSFKTQSGEAILQAHTDDPELPEIHKKLREVIEGHGGKFTFRGLKPHMTLARRDRSFTPEEVVAANSLLGAPVPVRDFDLEISRKRDGSHKWEKLNFQKVSYPIQSVKELFFARFGDSGPGHEKTGDTKYKSVLRDLASTGRAPETAQRLKDFALSGHRDAFLQPSKASLDYLNTSGGAPHGATIGHESGGKVLEESRNLGAEGSRGSELWSTPKPEVSGLQKRIALNRARPGGGLSILSPTTRNGIPEIEGLRGAAQFGHTFSNWNVDPSTVAHEMGEVDAVKRQLALLGQPSFYPPGTRAGHAGMEPLLREVGPQLPVESREAILSARVRSEEGIEGGLFPIETTRRNIGYTKHYSPPDVHLDEDSRRRRLLDKLFSEYGAPISEEELFASTRPLSGPRSLPSSFFKPGPRTLEFSGRALGGIPSAAFPIAGHLYQEAAHVVSGGEVPRPDTKTTARDFLLAGLGGMLNPAAGALGMLARPVAEGLSSAAGDPGGPEARSWMVRGGPGYVPMHDLSGPAGDKLLKGPPSQAPGRIPGYKPGDSVPTGLPAPPSIFSKLNSLKKFSYPITSVKEEFWRRFGGQLGDRDLSAGGRHADAEKAFLELLHHGAQGHFQIPAAVVEFLMEHHPEILDLLFKAKEEIGPTLAKLTPEEISLISRMLPQDAIKHLKGVSS